MGAATCIADWPFLISSESAMMAWLEGTTLGKETEEAPEAIRLAVADLWRAACRTEEEAYSSAAFRLLESNCALIYPDMSGSRLSKRPSGDSSRKELRTALENFFRWNEAPWHSGSLQTADDTARKLHRAFLVEEVTRFHYAPLDRLDLDDSSQRPHQSVENVRFGTNEIALLRRGELGRRVRHDALKRFGRWQQFPVERLDGFYWLVTSESEPAGALWERTWLGVLHKRWDEIGKVPVFEPTFPSPVEDALFVLLLCLSKESIDGSWEPFDVPWVYSFSDDPFADAPRAPDAAVMTWTLIGHPDEEIEVPDRSESFELGRQQLDTLEQRWRLLQKVLAKRGTERAILHPLTKHFFVKALSEEGIDEIVVNISCIEATLMLREHRGREKMKRRYRRLVDDDNEADWLERGYTLRDEYLHSLGHPNGTISWDDLGHIRLSVAKAVERYLDLIDEKAELNREELLRSLET
jgi:hypothetical protein